MFAISLGLMKVLSALYCTVALRTSLGERPLAFASAAITRSMRSPSTGPGQMQLTRMPNGPSSSAIDFVRPTMAHFAEAYGVRRAKPKIPADDDRLTMLP